MTPARTRTACATSYVDLPESVRMGGSASLSDGELDFVLLVASKVRVAHQKELQAVLAALRRAGAPYSLKPSQLYSRLRRSSGGMTKILKRLEASGLIERSPDPDDGRGSHVRLTDRGLSLQDRVFHAFVSATSSLMGPLSSHQLKNADVSLGEILQVFEERATQRSTAARR